MSKYLFSILIIVSVISSFVSAQEKPPDEKLNYFIGTWESKGLTEPAGDESVGNSIVNKVIGDKWLIWTFTAEMSWGPLEVITLINYDDIKKQYAFYSYNPMDEEPIPHFGNWEEERLLRIETDFGGEWVRVEFFIEDENNFLQVHSELNENKKWYVTAKTDYKRILQ